MLFIHRLHLLRMRLRGCMRDWCAAGYSSSSIARSPSLHSSAESSSSWSLKFPMTFSLISSYSSDLCWAISSSFGWTYTAFICWARSNDSIWASFSCNFAFMFRPCVVVLGWCIELIIPPRLILPFFLVVRVGRFSKALWYNSRAWSLKN